jgi:hypothetical protein
MERSLPSSVKVGVSPPTESDKGMPIRVVDVVCGDAEFRVRPDQLRGGIGRSRSGLDALWLRQAKSPRMEAIRVPSFYPL